MVTLQGEDLQQAWDLFERIRTDHGLRKVALRRNPMEKTLARNMVFFRDADKKTVHELKQYQNGMRGIVIDSVDYECSEEMRDRLQAFFDDVRAKD